MRLGGVLFDLKVPNVGHVNLYCGKVAIQIAANPIFYERTKHIKIDYHLNCDYLIKRVITTKFFLSNFQVADIFTKILSSLMLNIMGAKLSLVDFFHFGDGHKSKVGCVKMGY